MTTCWIQTVVISYISISDLACTTLGQTLCKDEQDMGLAFPELVVQQGNKYEGQWLHDKKTQMYHMNIKYSATVASIFTI